VVRIIPQGLLFHPDDAGGRFLRNIDTDPPNQTVSHFRRQYKLVSICTFARICNLIFTKQWNISLEEKQVT